MNKDKKFMEASSWERLTVGETGSCSDGRGCAQEIFNSMFCSCVGLCSLPVIWPEAQLLTHDSTRDSWTLTGSLIPSLVAILLLCPGSWCAHGFVCALQESIFQVLWKFCNQIPLVSKIKFPRSSRSLCQIPRLGNLLWVLELS